MRLTGRGGLTLYHKLCIFIGHDQPTDSKMGNVGVGKWEKELTRSTSGSIKSSDHFRRCGDDRCLPFERIVKRYLMSLTWHAGALPLSLGSNSQNSGLENL